MKIRNGFVSNSSSSSFIIDIPKEDLPLNKVEEFYGFKDDLDETTKGIMTYAIWRILNEFKRRGEFQETDDEFYDYHYVELGDSVEQDAEITEDFIESCGWCVSNEYYLKEGYTDKYLDNLKGMKDNGLKKFRFEVDNNSWCNDSIKILTGQDQSRLDEKAEYIFDKNADGIHAVGINQH